MLCKTGLDMPKSVQDATLAYHRENDKVGLFIEERLIEDATCESEPLTYTLPIRAGVGKMATTQKTPETLRQPFPMWGEIVRKDQESVARKPQSLLAINS